LASADFYAPLIEYIGFLASADFYAPLIEYIGFLVSAEIEYSGLTDFSDFLYALN